MAYGNICVEKNYPAGYLPAVPSFGENLTRIRKAAHLKAKDIAERVGVARSVVSGWENDRRGLPETPTLFRLAKALNCSIEELLSGVDAEYAAAAAERTTKAWELLGKKREIDFDEPGAWDRYNAFQALLFEARDAEEHARLAKAIHYALSYRDSDLPRHGEDQRSGSAQGGPDGIPAPSERDRISALVAENETLKARLATVEHVAGELLAIAAGDKDAAARRLAAAHRRGRRKAG